jgi:NADPH:quinone reductase-like Zn-dependent oxidoreductase
VLVQIKAGSINPIDCKIQLLQTFGISQFITTAGTEESVVYLSERFHLPADQIIQYRGRSRKDLAAEAIEKNGGRLFTKLLDFVGGDMKRLCFDLVAFDGEIVSVVEEIDPFAVPLWHGRPSPLFQQIGLAAFFLTRCPRTLRRTRVLGTLLPRSGTPVAVVRAAPVTARENGKSGKPIERDYCPRPRTS